MKEDASLLVDEWDGIYIVLRDIRSWHFRNEVCGVDTGGDSKAVLYLYNLKRDIHLFHLLCFWIWQSPGPKLFWEFHGPFPQRSTVRWGHDIASAEYGKQLLSQLHIFPAGFDAYHRWVKRARIVELQTNIQQQRFAYRDSITTIWRYHSAVFSRHFFLLIQR